MPKRVSGMQWDRNEFENGGRNFWSCRCTFFGSTVSTISLLVSAFVMISTVGQFIVCCSSTHDDLYPVKKWGHVSPVLYGVGAAGQFPRKYKLIM